MSSFAIFFYTSNLRFHYFLNHFLSLTWMKLKQFESISSMQFIELLDFVFVLKSQFRLRLSVLKVWPFSTKLRERPMSGKLQYRRGCFCIIECSTIAYLALWYLQIDIVFSYLTCKNGCNLIDSS